MMYDGEKATSERDRDRKRRARRMLCSGVHGSEELPKASDQPGKHSREALMISEKSDCRGQSSGRKWDTETGRCLRSLDGK